MDCEVAREALSARIDGEREPVPRRRVDEHLETCTECRQWYFRARDETRLLREMAGQTRPALNAVTETPDAMESRRPAGASWRWALAVVGIAQGALAVLQSAGIAMGVPADLHGTHAPMMSGHLVNESTAWSAALAVAMIAAALRPSLAGGAGVVLAAFSVVLVGYVLTDAMSAAVTTTRVVSHLPVLLGTLFTLMVHRTCRPTAPQPDTSDIVLPDNASRGRRRGHLSPTDDSAA